MFQRGYGIYAIFCISKDVCKLINSSSDQEYSFASRIFRADVDEKASSTMKPVIPKSTIPEKTERSIFSFRCFIPFTEWTRTSLITTYQGSQYGLIVIETERSNNDKGALYGVTLSINNYMVQPENLHKDRQKVANSRQYSINWSSKHTSIQLTRQK